MIALDPEPDVIHRVDGRDRQAAGVGIAPGQVRRARGQGEDSQQAAVGLEDPDPQRDGDIDPTGLVDLHPVGAAGLAGIEPGEDAARADASERPTVSTSNARTWYRAVSQT